MLYLSERLTSALAFQANELKFYVAELADLETLDFF